MTDPSPSDLSGPSSLTIMDHPLIQHKLAILRDKATGVRDFRALCTEISMLMAFEAMRDLPLEEARVLTPVASAQVRRLSGKKLALVAILRAGLIMADGILTLVPSARVGHIGLYRDPATLKPVEYYNKLPADIAERDIFVLDPMLATGGSAAAAITILRDLGAKSIKLLCIIAAPEGVAVIARQHPEVEIIVAAQDTRLNDHGYIVPGLGDAGDRIYGTK
ncbi:MAG: uracil phosphoribosyltransferase [Deinococcota bacterium]|jgi:uracil phosphoribosyltransferase|nr:uracil phosphoribosyltransferase [Deinococcota bacterium]